MHHLLFLVMLHSGTMGKTMVKYPDSFTFHVCVIVIYYQIVSNALGSKGGAGLMTSSVHVRSNAQHMQGAWSQYMHVHVIEE